MHIQTSSSLLFFIFFLCFQALAVTSDWKNISSLINGFKEIIKEISRQFCFLYFLFIECRKRSFTCKMKGTKFSVLKFSLLLADEKAPFLCKLCKSVGNISFSHEGIFHVTLLGWTKSIRMSISLCYTGWLQLCYQTSEHLNYFQ